MEEMRPRAGSRLSGIVKDSVRDEGCSWVTLENIPDHINFSLEVGHRTIRAGEFIILEILGPCVCGDSVCQTIGSREVTENG